LGEDVDGCDDGASFLLPLKYGWILELTVVVVDVELLLLLCCDDVVGFVEVAVTVVCDDIVRLLIGI
jgi:hypothetical protein